MKVIKPGTLPETAIHRATCSHCGCVMEFERREATFQSTCRNEDYLTVKCPTCKRDVWLEI